MAQASLTQVETQITPRAISNPTAQSNLTAKNVRLEYDDVSSKTCLSKKCIYKTETEMDKKPKIRKDDTETDSGDSDGESSEDSYNSSSESESDSDSDIPQPKSSKARSDKSASRKQRKRHKDGRRRKLKKKNKSERKEEKMDSSESATTDEGTEDLTAVESVFKSRGITIGAESSLSLLSRIQEMVVSSVETVASEDENSGSASDLAQSNIKKKQNRNGKKEKKRQRKAASKVDFRRLDEIWDEDLYDYKLKVTSEEKIEGEYDEYIFTVRRKFDDDGRHERTVVYVKSEVLKEVLSMVLADVECVSLVEDVPQLDPNTLFLFLDDFKALSATLKKEEKKSIKKKVKRALWAKREQLRVLIRYLDKDYDGTKKRLGPLLQSGRISFDLLWALFKPNTLVYLPTYDDDKQPRVVKLTSGYFTVSSSRGHYYEIEGEYLDFDGTAFGKAESYSEVMSFRGTRKISSLACYPLGFHQDQTKLKLKLLERGKKFLTLAGMKYRLYTGMAYLKKDDKILKANVNGRIMIDPETFRRINPNYDLESVEPRNLQDTTEEDDCCCQKTEKQKMHRERTGERLFRLVDNGNDDAQVIEVNATDLESLEQDVDSAEKEEALKNTFTEEELLTASAVLPGFSFSEKTWLEFAVSEVKTVVWNEGAFEKLVLPEKHKSIVQALVSAHSMHSSKGIDDVIAGKGKGLVAVLHGRPGLGKTLTCEAVSDLLRRPLYTVSAGDLGTNAIGLEHELQTILDIAHTWGAVLLMDEADVFLEERSIHDVHRNALVSIFLRLLEYFQGILFLTTNRVETFDEAFVSRIHLSLKYGDLNIKAKRSVWRTFIDKVTATEGMEVEAITEDQYTDLSRHEMNGRQIKNLVKTAQALSLHEGVPMSIKHIHKVIEVSRDFELDLKGGRGFEEAMRSYT